MQTLLLMRHAKSSWDDAAISDYDRPLNARGRRAAPRMGQLLREEGLVPDLIVTSSARRALETAQAVATAAGYAGRIEVTRRLYLAEPDTYLEVLSGIDPSYGRVLVVGHNPGISELVARLTSAPDDWQREELVTAAIAHVALRAERPFEGAARGGAAGGTEPVGELLGVFRPRDLD